ncbi:MAG: hypothetical protein IJP43_02790 [Oscillospiraceae bacterium]|nr:hypothetical protein [Oscillospiraceae bacterium]
MNKVFIASLVRNGVLGGSLTVDDSAVTYRTGKLTVPEKLRNLRIPFGDIASYETSVAKTILYLKNGESYTFIVFGNGKFAALLSEKRIAGHHK